MRPSAIRYEAKRLQPAMGFDGCTMRCAPVATQRSLAVIKLPRLSESLESAIGGCLREIAGVAQVHVDSSRSTIQLLYNGDQATVANVHRVLVATEWEDTRDNRRRQHHA